MRGISVWEVYQHGRYISIKGISVCDYGSSVNEALPMEAFTGTMSGGPKPEGAILGGAIPRGAMQG